MNELQIRLLEVLQQDALSDDGKLAVMLGRAEAEITAARKEMEKSGLIMGYGAIVNSEKLDNGNVSALIEVRITPQRDRGFDAIAASIYAFPEVKSCYLMSGAYDLMVIVEGENIRQVAGFVSEKLSVLDNVLSCATHFILKRYKQNDHVFAETEQDRRQVVSP